MVEKKKTQTQSVDFHYDCDLKNQEERIRAGACEQTTVMYLVACSMGFSFSFTFSLFFCFSFKFLRFNRKDTRFFVPLLTGACRQWINVDRGRQTSVTAQRNHTDYRPRQEHFLLIETLRTDRCPLSTLQYDISIDISCASNDKTIETIVTINRLSTSFQTINYC